MGGSESVLSTIEGYQVARVLENSPAHHCGLVPFFDIIVAVDGLQLDREHKMQFQQYVTKNVNKPIIMSVFNLRTRSLRELPATPSDAWGGVGVLGCSLNWETAERAIENSWHIVDVMPDTPAAAADLVAQRDFLIGMQPPDEETITMFADSYDFQDRLSRWKSLRSSNSRSVRDAILLMVFDSVSNNIKELDIPMYGQLSLGVDVANGYLHVIPQMPSTIKLPGIAIFHNPSVPKPAPYAIPTSSAPQQPMSIPPVERSPERAFPTAPIHPSDPSTQQQAMPQFVPNPIMPVPVAAPPPSPPKAPESTGAPPAPYPQAAQPQYQPQPQPQPRQASAPVPQALPFPSPIQFPTFPLPPVAPQHKQ